MAESVTFNAQVARVQTLADGGLRVTLDLPESAIEQVACLMAFKRVGVIGRVTYQPQEKDDGQPDESRKLHI
jgi:hypothetical protein